jgi:hypothetical protein
VGAALVAATQALAGEHVRAGHAVITQSQPAPVVAARAAASTVTVSLAVPAQVPAPSEPAYISLRGPDGQVRRFAVEGGSEALATRVVVLRPGESVTIRLAAK